MSSHASLNHIYRTVWNQALGVMVAVAEIVSGAGRGTATARRSHPSPATPPQSTILLTALSVGIAIAWGCVPASAFANPSGAVAIVGQASLVNQGNKLTVTTQNGVGGNYSAINWQSFSIPSGNTTYFQQPNATSTSINRVVTNTPSLLFGTLGSNGKLVLVNQSGIAVGAGAVVDTAGFTASSLLMSDADALTGRLRFGDGSASATGVSAQGSILARSGDVVLLGSKVEAGKDALIQAPNGSTILAAGQQIEITGRGLEGISMKVQAPTDQAVNLGTLQGGAVGIFAGTLKHSGLIQATAATLEGGKVVLKASGDAYVEGTGKILASGTKGGSVDVLGNRVALTDQAVIDASGEQGGGTVRVGGDFQGKNPDVQNANITYFGPQASIKADATTKGDGGKAIVWADDTTRAYGSISARGGEHGGNGGFVETSGHRYLDFQGLVDTLAPKGTAGTLLLDPIGVTIDNSTTDVLGGGALSSGVFSGATTWPTLTWSTINAQTGSLEIRTNSTPTGPSGDININASGVVTGPTNLTLLANGNINVATGVTVGGGTTSANFNMVAGWNNTGWAVSPGTGKDIVFGTGSSLSTTGNIWFNAGNAVNQPAGSTITANTLSIGNTNGGSLPGGVSLLGTNMVNTLAVQIDSTTGSLTFVNGKPLSIGTGLYFNGIVANGNTNLIDISTTTGALAIAQSINTAGALNLTTTNSAITQTAALTVSGTTTVQAGTGNVTLDNTGNDFASLAVRSAGTVNVKDLNAVTLNAISTSGTFTLKAAGNLTLGAALASAATGDAAVLISDGTFTAGTGGSISTPNGRWLAYLKDPGGHTFPVTPAFKQYNAPFGTTVLGSGNGVLYNNTTPAVLKTSLTGSVSKVYDGGVAIDLAGATVGAIPAGTAGGYIDGDSSATLTLAGATGNLSNPNVGSSIPVTATGLTVSGVVGGNGIGTVYGYRTEAVGNIGTVDPARAIASIDLNGNRVYDGTNIVRASIFSLSGLVGGETLTLTGNGTVADANVGVNKPVALGSLALGDGTGLASNYTFGGGTQTATITPANLTVTANNASKTYNAVAYSGGNGVVYRGFVSSETESVLGGTLRYSGNSQGAINAGGYVITPGGLTSNNYTVAYVNGTLTINKANVNAIGLNGTRVYDGTNTVNAGTFALSGMIGTETLTLTGSGTVADKNVGVNKPVSRGSLTLGNGTGLASNYTLAGVSQLASITPASLTLTSSNVSKTYDGSLSALGSAMVASGTLFGGDALSGGSFAFTDKNAGSNRTVTASGITVNDGNGGNNYSVSYANNTSSTISPRALTASVTAPNKVYDGTVNASPTLSITGGLLSGETVSATGTASFNNKDVASANLVTVNSTTLKDGANGLASNYSLASGETVAARITPASLSVTANNASKTYNGVAYSGGNGVSYTGLVNSETSSVLGGTLSYSGSSQGAVNAGSYVITPGGLTSSNYTVAFVDGILTINKANVNAISLNGTRVYDGTNVVNAGIFALSGMIGTESLTLFGSGAMADKNVGVNKPVSLGNLALGNGSGLASNYTLTGGTLSATITPAAITGVSGITASNKIYDGTTAAMVTTGSAKLAGAISGDSVSVTGATGAFSDKNAGVGKTVNITGLNLSGPDANNYTLASKTASATADISQATITGVSGITAGNKVYDGNTSATLSTSAATLAGLNGGDDVSVMGATGAFSDKNAGVGKIVNITGLGLSGADAPNYSLSATTASTRADISKAAITAVSGISASNKVYDGNTSATLNTGSASLIGAISGDSVSVSAATGAFSDKNAGLGKTVNITGLSLGGADSINYTLGSTTASTTADISKAAITGVSGISASNKVYDGNTSATLNTGSASLIGAISGDSVSVSAATGAFSDKNAGLGKTVNITGLSLGGADSINYTLGSTTASTTADISKAAITGVSGISASNKVYDGNTSATLNTGSASLVGAISGDSVSVSAATGAFSDKNAGLGKTVNITGLSLGGADSINYSLSATTASTTADIGKAAITGVSGIAINDKIYDGNVVATAVTTGASLAGLISGDKVSVGAITAAFDDKNVGVGKTVNITNLALSGVDAGNYTLTGHVAPTQGTITARPLSTWTAAGSGQWSTAGNWDALPDASNVLAVTIPAGISVVYDAPAGDTSLQSIGGAGSFSLAGGKLSIASGLSTPQYSQSGGTLNLSGALSVNGSFSQTAGIIAAGGPVTITHSVGNLSVGAITAPAISLSAPSGSVGQGGALVTTGLLATQSMGSTLLNDAGNRIGSFKAVSTGSGNIELTNVGPLNVQGINAAAGNITVVNTGGISTSGPVVAHGGAVSMTANSPLTIGSAGVSASGNIDLVATNLTSAGNLTLNGDLVSSAGAITLSAANNFEQNSKVSAARGLSVSAGGGMTLGPLATSFGNPVNYGRNGVSVAPPPGSVTANGGAPTDSVVGFLAQFEKSVVAQELVSVDPLNQTDKDKEKDKDKRATTVEGDICLR